MAGEHVSTSHSATVHGALSSGTYAAKRLAARDLGGAGTSIIVVGAGVAGLAAARDLQAAGATVVVLEARDRIGGRVCTDHSWGVPIELGAAWIHGVGGGNPLPALVRSGGSTLVQTDYEDEDYGWVSGHASGNVDRATNRLDRIITAMEDGEYTVGDSVQDALTDSGWRPSVVNNFVVESVLTQEYGVNPSVLGTAAFSEGEDDVGEDALVKGGYDVVPNQLAEGLTIRTGSPVASVRAAASSGAVTVTLRSGEVLTADAAVVAVPLSIVRGGSLKLEPMTAGVRQALLGLRMGSLEKVILQYPTRWWPDTQVLGAIGGPGRRWIEWYDLTPLVGSPTVVGFSAATAAAGRPRSDATCIAEAAGVLSDAFA